MDRADKKRLMYEIGLNSYQLSSSQSSRSKSSAEPASIKEPAAAANEGQLPIGESNEAAVTGQEF